MRIYAQLFEQLAARTDTPACHDVGSPDRGAAIPSAIPQDLSADCDLPAGLAAMLGALTDRAPNNAGTGLRC